MKPRAGRGALVIVALLFASSGALRIGDGLGTALAESAAAKEEESHADPAAHGDMVASAEGASHDDAPMPTGECPAPPAALAAALAEREGQLTAMAATLADREAALALADAAIRVRLEELQRAEEQLRATISLADGAAEEDIARLVAVYETMKPKDAARLFDAMEADFSAGFLGRMRPDAAAAIMAGMAPEKAYAVSAILAGRNAAVPKE